MRATWDGCTKLIEAQDKRIAELKAQVERLNRQLDYALKEGDRKWAKEHARLNDFWNAEEGDYILIREYGNAEVYSNRQDALEEAFYYQNQHERCAIIRISDFMEPKEDEDEYSDPRADKVMYDEEWKYADNAV